MPRDGRSASAAVPDSAAAAASSTADASSNHNNSTNTGNSSTAEPTSIKSKLKLRVAQYRTQRDRKKGGSAPVTNPPNSRHSLKAKSKKGKGESLGASESEEEEQQEQPNPDQVEAGKRQDEASSTETGEANSARTTTEGELSEGGATAGSESIDARDASVDAESPHMKRTSSPEKVGGKTALAAANSADEAVQGSSGSDSKKGGHSSGNNSASKEISATAHDTEVVPSSASSFAESEDDPVPARLPGKERFVSYFFVVGIDEQMTPMETPNPVPVLQRPYTGRLVELFPRHTKEDPFPDHVWLFCFPRGVQLRVATDQPAPITFPFVLTTLSGDKLFGQGLTMYERLSNNAKARLNVDDAAIIEAAAVSSGSVQNDSSKLEVWTPRCVCLLSQWPFFSTFREWLAEFYDRIFSRKLPIPIEEYIIDIVMRVPLPPPRFDVLIEFSMHEKWLSVARPPRGMFDDGGIPLAMLFKVLSLQNVFTVLRAVLLEERILLVSRRMTLLTYAAETLRMILYPFAWPHVYIPVLPHNLIEFAAYTPLPFIIGVPRETLPLITSLSDASPEIFIVDLDNNTVSTPVPLLKLPEPEFSELRRDLTALLYRDVDALDNPCQPGPRVNALSASESSVMTSAHIACAFRRFFASMMKDYREYLLYLRVFPQPVAMFDTAKFVAARTAEASKMDASDVSSAEEDGGARSDQELREFFEAFMETQAFQVFLEDHNWPTPNAFDSMIDQRTYELPFHECLAKLAGSFLPSRDRPETLPGGRLRVEHIRILPRHKKMAGAPFVYSQFPVLNKEVLRSAEGLRPITVGGAAKLPNSSGNHAEQESPLNQKHHAPQEKSTEGSERVSKRIRAIVKSPIESTQPPLSEKRLASLIQTFSSSEVETVLHEN